VGRLTVLVGVLLVAASLTATGGGATPSQPTKLFGTVGPEFTITLEDAQGSRVTKLDPGAYEIEVNDLSDFHNFSLRGPGVSETTQVEFTGKVTWTVAFTDGTYTFLCDVHPSSMRGTVTAGTPPSAPPSGGSGSPGAITAKTKLALTSGPGYKITLRTATGKRVRTMRTGTYTVVVRDRSQIHNAHLVAPGANRFTTVPYRGTRTWKVKLARAGTLQFLCDPHARQGMRGSAKIVRS
jgi:plastocyanin